MTPTKRIRKTTPVGCFRMLSLQGRTICCQVLCQIGDSIAGGLHRGGTPGSTGSSSGVYAGGVINEIGVKSCGFDLLIGEVSGQLMNYGSYHLQMTQLFGTYRGVEMYHFGIRNIRTDCLPIF